MKLILQSQDGTLARLAVQGRVSQRDVLSETEPLKDVLGEEAYGKRILLDMSEVMVLDSSGVNWLLICQRKLRERGGQLVLHSLSPIAMNVIKVLNLQSVFTMAADEQQARALLEGDAA